MMAIKQTINLPGGRLETGAVKFGGDWPGVFIRGDEALGLAGNIGVAQAAGMLPNEGPGAVMLQQISDLLRSCKVKV